MNIVLGSTSSQKVAAVKRAIEKLGLDADVLAVKTHSGQNEQPVGFNETLAGALVRAVAAREREPERVAIGIESGIFRVGPSMVLDMAVVVVIRNDGRWIVTTSEGVQFPEDCVQEAEKRGFETTTVGSVIAERFGGDPTDPHATLTKGQVTRTMTLVDALVVALKQL